MGHRYRSNKIKLRHHVLAPLLEILERIAAYPEVTAITPGAIAPKRGPSVGLTVQYRTPSGLRLIGRSGGAAQEVYVVTAAPDAVMARLVADGYITPAADAGGASPDPPKQERKPAKTKTSRAKRAKPAHASQAPPRAGTALLPDIGSAPGRTHAARTRADGPVRSSTDSFKPKSRDTRPLPTTASDPTHARSADKGTASEPLPGAARTTRATHTPRPLRAKTEGPRGHRRRKRR